MRPMGAHPELDRRCVRFGVFELNTASGELRKHGVRVRLQDQPLKLLLCLLDTPGVICTREELIRKIWPDGTFVDYDRGLNATVTRLRQVLGDSADTPRYVETVGRKGYRFIAPLQSASEPEREPAGQPENAAVGAREPAQPLWLSGKWRLGAVLMIGLMIGLAIGGSAVWWRPTRPMPQPLVRLSTELGPEMTGSPLRVVW